MVKHINSDYQQTEQILEIICLLSDLNIKTRVLFSQTPDFWRKLMGLLVSPSKIYARKIHKIIIRIIKNIIVTPIGARHLLPYRNQLMIIAGVNSQISQPICKIIKKTNHQNIDHMKTVTDLISAAMHYQNLQHLMETHYSILLGRFHSQL